MNKVSKASFSNEDNYHNFKQQVLIAQNAVNRAINYVDYVAINNSLNRPLNCADYVLGQLEFED
jgi:hypothetical protein